LLLATSENRNTIADEIAVFLKETIALPEPELAGLAAGLALDLAHPLYTIQIQRQVSSDVREYWEELSHSIVSSESTRIRVIAGHDGAVALRCYWYGLISLSDGVAVFGIPFLVGSVRAAALGNMWFYPPGYMLVDAVLSLRWSRPYSKADRMKRASELESVASVFLRTSTPWLRQEHRRSGPPHRLLFSGRKDREDVKPEVLEISSDASFAAMCILAVDFEHSNRRRNLKDLGSALASEWRSPELYRAVLLGRLSESNSKAATALDRLGFNSAQRDLFIKWLDREVDFTQPRGAVGRPSIIQK
jgi:hypothetical protein